MLVEPGFPEVGRSAALELAQDDEMPAIRRRFEVIWLHEVQHRHRLGFTSTGVKEPDRLVRLVGIVSMHHDVGVLREKSRALAWPLPKDRARAGVEHGGNRHLSVKVMNEEEERAIRRKLA